MNSENAERLLFLLSEEERCSSIFEDLEQFLQHRPKRETLVSNNILKDYKITPALFSATEKIVWSKRTRTLQKKIAQRPSLQTLRERGIIQEHDKHEEYKQLAFALEEKVQNRPEPSMLVERGILLQQRISPRIQRTISQLSRNVSRDTVSQQIAKRTVPLTHTTSVMKCMQQNTDTTLNPT